MYFLFMDTMKKSCRGGKEAQGLHGSLSYELCRTLSAGQDKRSEARLFLLWWIMLCLCEVSRTTSKVKYCALFGLPVVHDKPLAGIHAGFHLR